MKKCYCGQENDDSVTLCVQCGGVDFMGQRSTPPPIPAAPPPKSRSAPNANANTDAEVARLTVWGNFRLREKDARSGSSYKTVVTSLGGIKQGILMIGRHQIELRQRLTVVGGILVALLCFLAFVLLMAIASFWPAVENIAGFTALAFLAATIPFPLISAWRTRKFKRVFNLADISKGETHGEELELHFGRNTDTSTLPSAPLSELVFRPTEAGNLAKLRDLLMESRVKVTEFGTTQMVDFLKALAVATPKAWVTQVLVALNVVAFLVMLINTGSIAFPVNGLLYWGADFGPLTVNSGQWWRLLSSCFLHAGLLHLVFNMYALYVGGLMIERFFGNWYFLFTYLACGLAGNLASLWVNPALPCVGASGAIFGIFGALLGYLAREGSGLPRRVFKPVLTSALVFVAWNVFYGCLSAVNHYADATVASVNSMKGTGHNQTGGMIIDWAAHAGGFLSGIIFGFLGARSLETPTRREAVLNRSIALALAVPLLCALLLVPVLKANALTSTRTALLAAMYFRGDGVPKNPVLSVRWASEAAAQGNVDAEKMLVGIYFSGQGVPMNPALGIQWLSKLVDQGADQGLDDVEKAVAVAYMRGDGVPADEVEAAKWAARVADRGDAQAKALLFQIKYETANSASPGPGDVWFIRYIFIKEQETGESVMEAIRNHLSFDDAAAKVGAKASLPYWTKPGKLQKPVEDALNQLTPGQTCLVKTANGYYVICLLKTSASQ